MTTNLVERLRYGTAQGKNPEFIMGEAADEIEKLEAAFKICADQFEKYVEGC